MIAFMSLSFALWLLPGLVIGLTLHEFAHAWSASLLGDDFPRRNGRVSLNPLRHLSPLGTLAIFLLPIGWGKPVMVNLYNFRRPKRDYLLTSLAGPLANLFLAGLLFLLMLLTRHTYWFGPGGSHAMLLAHDVLRFTAIINLSLAALNLLPIPPLDGSKIWPCLIPGARPGMSKRVTMAFTLIILVLASTKSFRLIIGPVVELAVKILPESDYDRHATLGQSYEDALDDKDYALAEHLSDELLALKGPSPEGYYCRAYARGEQKNWMGALDDLNTAILLAPAAAESAKYYHWRAGILRYLGRPEQAAADRRKALELDTSLGADQPASQPDPEPTTRGGP
jgi:Zn-dependent protease